MGGLGWKKSKGKLYNIIIISKNLNINFKILEANDEITRFIYLFVIILNSYSVFFQIFLDLTERPSHDVLCLTKLTLDIPMFTHIHIINDSYYL